MFDVGFWELVLIALVALVVLGPERLPRAARVAGLWIAKARRIVSDVQAEIERELDLEDIRRIGQHERAKLSDLINETRSTLSGTGTPRPSPPAQATAPDPAAQRSEADAGPDTSQR